MIAYPTTCSSAVAKVLAFAYYYDNEHLKQMIASEEMVERMLLAILHALDLTRAELKELIGDVPGLHKHLCQLVDHKEFVSCLEVTVKNNI